MFESLAPTEASALGSPVAALPPLEGDESALYEALRGLRRQLASERGVPMFHILTNRSLRDLTVRRPMTTDALLQVYGIGQAKKDAFGILLLVTLKAEVARLGLPPGRVEVHPQTSVPPEPRLPGQRAVAVAAFCQGKSIAEVMTLTGRAQTTVAGYLEDLVTKHRPAHLQPWIDPSMEARARQALVGDTGGPLKPVFERHDGRVSYVALRLVRALLRPVAG